MRLLGNPELVKHGFEVLLLIDIKGSGPFVTSNSSSKNLPYLPQVLGFKSLWQFRKKSVELPLLFGCGNYIVDVYQESDIILCISKYTWVRQALDKAPAGQLVFN